MAKLFKKSSQFMSQWYQNDPHEYWRYLMFNQTQVCHFKNLEKFKTFWVEKFQVQIIQKQQKEKTGIKIHDWNLMIEDFLNIEGE